MKLLFIIMAMAVSLFLQVVSILLMLLLGNRQTISLLVFLRIFLVGFLIRFVFSISEHMIERRSSFVGSMQISISMSVIMMKILSRWGCLR